MIGYSLNDDSELTESSTAYHNLLDHSQKLSARIRELEAERDRSIAERDVLRGNLAEAERERDQYFATLNRSDKAWLDMLEAADKGRDEARKLLHDLTPGGSEFAGDPKACAEWIRKARNNQHEALVRCAKDRIELRARLGEAERRLSDDAVREVAQRDALTQVAMSPQTNCTGAHHKRCDCIGDVVRAVLFNPSSAAEAIERQFAERNRAAGDFRDLAVQAEKRAQEAAAREVALRDAGETLAESYTRTHVTDTHQAAWQAFMSVLRSPSRAAERIEAVLRAAKKIADWHTTYYRLPPPEYLDELAEAVRAQGEAVRALRETKP